MLTEHEIWSMMANEMKLFRLECNRTRRSWTFTEMAEHLFVVMRSHNLIDQASVYKPVPEPGPNLTEEDHSPQD